MLIGLGLVGRKRGLSIDRQLFSASDLANIVPKSKQKFLNSLQGGVYSLRRSSVIAITTVPSAGVVYGGIQVLHNRGQY